MEKKFKLIISPERCDAEALAHFIAELERLKLGVLTNGEIVYDDKNEKEVFNLTAAFKKKFSDSNPHGSVS